MTGNNEKRGMMISYSVSLALILLSLPSPSYSFAYTRWGARVLSPSRGGAVENNNVKLFVATDMEQEQRRVQQQRQEKKNLRTVDVLSLDSIRSSLIRQEETIIFALIERAQFRSNDIVYKKGGFGALGIPDGSRPPSSMDLDEDELTFMEYVMVGTESFHARVRRYTSPEEYAFFPERLPDTGGPLPTLQYPDDLLSTKGGADDVNINKLLLDKYVNVIVPQISKDGDDEQHGSTVLCDIAILQALSKRIHYGKFVAESKYRSDPSGYQKLVDNDDADGVMELLTNRAVEAKVLSRAWLKASTYGMEPSLPTIDERARRREINGQMGMTSNDAVEEKIDPAVIESIYRDIIIPMTKEIEVAYLFLRCGKQPPPEYTF